MNVDYYDKPEKSDPCQAHRYLHINFDTPAEIAALNCHGTPERILDYARRAMNAFLAENRTYGSQLERGRSE